MGEAFDPYRKWLGIGSGDQPPHCYRLLGIPLFEDDPDVISNAADRQMAHLRTFQSSQYSDLSQKLLNEVSSAKVLLLNQAKKAQYDQQLRAKIQSDSTPKPPQATVASVSAAAQPPDAMPVISNPISKALEAEQPATAELLEDISLTPKKKKTYSKRRSVRKKTSNNIYVICGVAGVALAALLIFIVLSTSGDGSDKSAKKTVKKASSSKTSGKKSKSTESKKMRSRRRNQRRPKPRNEKKKSQHLDDPNKKPASKDDELAKKKKSKDKAKKKNPRKSEPQALPILAKLNLNSNEGKHEPPTEKERSKLQRQVRRQFSFDDKKLAQFSAAETKGLVAKLYDEATKTKNDYPYKFALLNEIKLIGQAEANTVVASLAIDAITEDFKIDAMEMKADSILRISKVINDRYKKDRDMYVKKNTEIFDKSEILFKESIAREQYELSGVFVKYARNAASRTKNFRAKSRLEPALLIARSLQTLQKNFLQQLPVYKKDPKDKKACYDVGLFLCASRKNWKDGCTLLSRGDDSEVKKAALLDLENPTTSNEQLKLAEKWADLAKKKGKAALYVFLERARYWYETSTTNEAESAKVQKELARIEKLIGPKLTSINP